MLTLYDYFRSSASFRVRIALNYKGLQYDKCEIDLRDKIQYSDNYLKVNPSGLIPTLIDSNHEIYQSLAIIEYLEEKYPSLPRLLPESCIDRAYVRSIALTIACDIHPLNNLRVLNYLTNNLKHNEDAKNSWYQNWIHTGLNTLERMIKLSQNNLDKYYTGTYCYKDQFSIADLCLIPQLFNAKRFNCDLNNYPILCSIEKECLKLEAVQLAYPVGHYK